MRGYPDAPRCGHPDAGRKGSEFLIQWITDLCDDRGLFFRPSHGQGQQEFKVE